MKIIRNTQTELVIEDGCLGLAAIFFIASLPLFYAATLSGKGGSIFAACLFVIFSSICIRKTVFIFDRDHEMVCWKGLLLFQLSSGRVPFSEIIDIGTEPAANNSRSFSHRLALRTRQGFIPLASSFGGSSNRNAAVRQAILSFMRAAVRQG